MDDAARTATAAIAGPPLQHAKVMHLVFSLGLVAIFIHIDRLVRGVHIHTRIRLLLAAGMICRRSTTRAAAPGGGHAACCVTV